MKFYSSLLRYEPEEHLHTYNRNMNKIYSNFNYLYDYMVHCLTDSYFLSKEVLQE